MSRNKYNWFGLRGLPMLAWAVVILFSIGPGLAGNTDTFDFELGHWLGQSDRSEGRTQTGCTLALHNETSAMLVFRLGRNGQLSLGLFGSGWKAQTGKTEQSSTPLILLADHNLIRTAAAVPIGKDGLFLQIQNSALVLQQLRDSSMLSLSLGNQQLVFRLKGSRRAIQFLENCSRERSA